MTQTQLEVAPTEEKLDVIEEMRLRTWARRNYTSEDEREQDWHPVILDEMRKVDSGS